MIQPPMPAAIPSMISAARMPAHCQSPWAMSKPGRAALRAQATWPASVIGAIGYAIPRGKEASGRSFWHLRCHRA